MNIFSSNYLSRHPIDCAMREFGLRFSPDQRVLDIGCGKKPYRSLFKSNYVGVDTESEVKPDIVANAWNIPLPNASFDGIILNQSLEHIAETEMTVREIERLLKPGGLLMVTAPHTMKNHASAIPAAAAPVQNFNHQNHPTWRVDYYRFTKFGLIYLFRRLQTVSIKETSGYGGTIFQLINYFLASIGPNWLFFLFYGLNNVIGLTIDRIFALLTKAPGPLFKKMHDQVYLSLPVNYIGIFKKISSIEK